VAWPLNEIAWRRLAALGLLGSADATVEAVVGRLGAVQSQDFAGGKWSIGRRAPITDQQLDEAYTQGRLLRTHVLRATWHFVLPEDIRWLLAVTSPRVQVRNAYMYRQLGLSEALLRKAEVQLAEALGDGRHATRRELQELLDQQGMALGYVLMNAELNGLICSGVPRGRQHTYALLDERFPADQPLHPEDQLAALATRYFTAHGPATLGDFTWWSTLTTADARRAVELCQPALESERIGGTDYWAAAVGQPVQPGDQVHLLQGYDEYFVGYSGNSKWALDVSQHARAQGDYRGAFTHVLVSRSQVVGRWRRAPDRRHALVEVQLFGDLDVAELEAEVQRYGDFLGLAASYKLVE
jgi:Winged helix DNA-binding domain